MVVYILKASEKADIGLVYRLLNLVVWWYVLLVLLGLRVFLPLLTTIIFCHILSYSLFFIIRILSFILYWHIRCLYRIFFLACNYFPIVNIIIIDIHYRCYLFLLTFIPICVFFSFFCKRIFSEIIGMFIGT
jgi:hypothetical protein